MKAYSDAARDTWQIANDTSAALMRGTTKQLETGPMRMSEVDIQAALRLSETVATMWTDATVDAMRFGAKKWQEWVDVVASGDPERVAEYVERQAEILDIVANKNPEAIAKAKLEYGLRFNERPDRYERIAEAPEAELHQVLPIKEGVEVQRAGKPVIFIAPFILSDGILGLLPDEGISLVHSFANEGTPTYVVHFKDIRRVPEVADLGIERTVDVIGEFLDVVRDRHGREATVDGVCQGALVAAAGFMSGRWEGKANCLIQTVPPNDLSRSPEWQRFLALAPASIRDIEPLVMLPTGKEAYAGPAGTLSMRLQAGENPESKYFGAIEAAEKGAMNPFAAAVGAYLESYREHPMPAALTRISRAGAFTPIGPNERGKLPWQFAGEDMHFANVLDHAERWGIIYGSKDTVVSPEVARAPLDVPEIRKYMEAHPEVVTVTEVKGGHIAPMTNKIEQAGAYALHKKWEADEDGRTEDIRIAA